MDYIYHSYCGDTTKANITFEHKTMLENVKPLGCPFVGYTLFDLLCDFIKMYAWLVNGKISLIDFVKLLQSEGYEKAIFYGNEIINILSTQI